MVKCFGFMIVLAGATSAMAQEYRIVCQTVYDEQQVTAYKIENELVYDEQQRTSYRPVYETEYRENRYRVARPVSETSEREERYKVMRPVWETQVRDTSYDVTRMVAETSEREERYVVNRPVQETQEREQRYTVQRQVMETAERDEQFTVNEPVTTYTTNYVDAGGFIDQQVVTPSPVRNRLRWVPGACVVDPCTGAARQSRSGLAWVPEQAPPRVAVVRSWQPNIVAQQVPQTTMVARVMTRKVPVQVCRTVEEQVVQKVPVQVCRIVQEEQVRRVPVTTYRPVTERVQQQTPVQVCKMVEEEVVRRVPVTTCRMVVEERVDQVPVQVCKMVAEQQTVRVPRVVEKRVPVVYTQRVPRTVVMRVPIDPCAPACCGGEVATGAVISTPPVQVQPAQPGSRITPPSTPQGSYQSTPGTSGNTTYGQPTPAKPNGNGSSSVDSKSSDGANKNPEIGPNEKVGPVDEESGSN